MFYGGKLESKVLIFSSNLKFQNVKLSSKNKEKYLKLLNEINSISQTLENEHKKHINCKSGCDLCCMDYSIFPIEFYFILEKLKKQNPEMDSLEVGKSENECIFLKDHSCTIYNSRPIICRTHGLPLLYTNDDGEWELSTCELNFTKYKFEKFTPKNTFPQDKFNSKLFLINKEFISESEEKIYGEFDLIPLKELINKF